MKINTPPTKKAEEVNITLYLGVVTTQELTNQFFTLIIRYTHSHNN